MDTHSNSTTKGILLLLLSLNALQRRTQSRRCRTTRPPTSVPFSLAALQSPASTAQNFVVVFLFLSLARWLAGSVSFHLSLRLLSPAIPVLSFLSSHRCTLHHIPHPSSHSSNPFPSPSPHPLWTRVKSQTLSVSVTQPRALRSALVRRRKVNSLSLSCYWLGCCFSFTAGPAICSLFGTLISLSRLALSVCSLSISPNFFAG